MNQGIDKLAWLHVHERRVLCARSRGRSAAYLPGGKREQGESDTDALIREIREELTVKLLPETIVPAAMFEAQAHGKPDGIKVRMRCYWAEYQGVLAPASEIEALVWTTYADRARCSPAMQLVLDWLRERRLID